MACQQEHGRLPRLGQKPRGVFESFGHHMRDAHARQLLVKYPEAVFLTSVIADGQAEGARRPREPYAER